MEVTHGRGYVYSIQYHIVWCVKYRHKILTLKIENRLVELEWPKHKSDRNYLVGLWRTNKTSLHDSKFYETGIAWL